MPQKYAPDESVMDAYTLLPAEIDSRCKPLPMVVVPEAVLPV